MCARCESKRAAPRCRCCCCCRAASAYIISDVGVVVCAMAFLFGRVSFVCVCLCFMLEKTMQRDVRTHTHTHTILLLLRSSCLIIIRTTEFAIHLQLAAVSRVMLHGRTARCVRIMSSAWCASVQVCMHMHECAYLLILTPRIFCHCAARHCARSASAGWAAVGLIQSNYQSLNKTGRSLLRFCLCGVCICAWCESFVVVCGVSSRV